MEKQIDIINNAKRRKLSRPITGIIQDDRIWEQWYEQEIFDLEFPYMSQKDYLIKCIGSETNRIILNNRGKNFFTVRDFLNYILRFEKAFAAYNLKEGDVICTICLSTPELYAIKYASTSLGIITCNLNVFDLDIYDSEMNRLIYQIENVNPKMIFILDIFEARVFSLLNSPQLADIIKIILPLDFSVSRFDFEKFKIKINEFGKKIERRTIQKRVMLADFLHKGENINNSDLNEVYEKGLPCNISFTSGTTGINKPVLLSHDANNILAFQHKIGGFNFKKGSKNLALVPPFLAFWDADIVHTVLCLGGVEIIELLLQYDKIPQYIRKYEPNMGIWSQYLWSSILNIPQDELNEAAKKLDYVIVGGERCEISEAKKFYEKTGIIQMAGYGASEVNTAFTLSHPDCSKIGTAGIPLPFNNIKIVDDSFNDLTYNKAGKLLITGPCLFNGYYKNDALTGKVIYKDKNGIRWYLTGDYAVIDDDGCLIVLDRYMESIVLNCGKKANLIDIAELVKKQEHIKNCKTTFNNNKLIFHISVTSNDDKLQEEAERNIINNLKETLLPEYYPNVICIYSELPRTAVGKVDLKRINEIGNEMSNNVKNSNSLWEIIHIV